MFYCFQGTYKLLALLLSGTGLFLSCWIIVPAPIWLLLPLAVAAPELSPWLLVLNAIAIPLALIGRRSGWPYLASISLVGLLLSALPLIQLPAIEQQLAAAMRQGLGPNYLTQIPRDVQARMRLQPFVLADTFRGIHPRHGRHTASIQFASPTGVPLRLDIYRPPQVGNYPAIVAIYGGAWQHGSPTENADFNRYMAAQGYTVFAIDYRHAPRHRFPAQLDDVRAAIAFVRQHATEYEADPNRIALVGRSAGAHLAMLAAYQPDALPVRAVVNYYGPVDLIAGYAEPPRPDPINVRPVLEAFLGGSPDELPQQYRVASPISYVSRRTQSLPPTLLVYGSRDHIVEVRFGRSFYEQLDKGSNTAVLLEIPWADHAFDAVFQGPSSQLALYYTERFLAWALR